MRDAFPEKAEAGCLDLLSEAGAPQQKYHVSGRCLSCVHPHCDWPLPELRCLCDIAFINRLLEGETNKRTHPHGRRHASTRASKQSTLHTGKQQMLVSTFARAALGNYLDLAVETNLLVVCATAPLLGRGDLMLQLCVSARAPAHTCRQHNSLIKVPRRETRIFTLTHRSVHTGIQTGNNCG